MDGDEAGALDQHTTCFLSLMVLYLVVDVHLPNCPRLYPFISTDSKPVDRQTKSHQAPWSVCLESHETDSKQSYPQTIF